QQQCAHLQPNGEGLRLAQRFSHLGPRSSAKARISMFRHAYTLLLLASFFWAGNAIGGKLALGHVSPMVLNSARWAIAIIIIAAIGRSEFRKDWPVLKSRLLYIFLLGTVGFTLFNVVLYNAVRYTTVINVSIEQAAMPMF